MTDALDFFELTFGYEVVARAVFDNVIPMLCRQGAIIGALLRCLLPNLCDSLVFVGFRRPKGTDLLPSEGRNPITSLGEMPRHGRGVAVTQRSRRVSQYADREGSGTENHADGMACKTAIRRVDQNC